MDPGFRRGSEIRDGVARVPSSVFAQGSEIENGAARVSAPVAIPAEAGTHPEVLSVPKTQDGARFLIIIAPWLDLRVGPTARSGRGEVVGDGPRLSPG